MTSSDETTIRRHQVRLAEILAAAPVVPVLTVHDAEAAVPLARALAAGGLPIVEITLRTPAAVAAIERIREALPEILLGAGTVLDAAQMRRVCEAGVDFAVSPGATDRVLAAAGELDLPLLPGATTPSETQRLLERGYRHQKFFPAEPSGGAPYLRALHGPLEAARFCPTGGIGPGNARDYLACPNVVCVGGSWVAPAAAVEAGDWAAIEALAREARALGEAASC